MSISYEEALDTLQSMFGEPWTVDSLDTVLREQKGHMENTVDLILRHGDKDPQILIDQLRSGVNPVENAIRMDEQLAMQLSSRELAGGGSAQDDAAAAASATSTPNNTAASGGSGGGGAAQTSAGSGGVGGASGAPAVTAAASSSSTAPKKTGRGTPTALPDDFLRIPGSVRTSIAMDTDEALARMLQDELFSEELARNPDFAHLARGRIRATAGGPFPGTRRTTTTPNNNNSGGGLGIGRIGELSQGLFGGSQNNNQSGGAVGGQQNPQQSPNFAKMITELGDGAKRKLQTMAAQFNASRNAVAGRVGVGGGAQGGNAANSSGAAERRSLLEDDTDNMELAARKDL